jgi:UDP-N-acetylmuramoylalanine--D-glutamate ligase
VVLLGRDRNVIADALERLAPEVPVVVVETLSDPMPEVVRAADRVAEPGDTVLLAPGCASMDQFRDYASRGQAFVDAVKTLP